jgi:hypothetical protein
MKLLVKSKIPQTIFFILLSCLNAIATTYYVSPSGNNGNLGTTENAPFKTIQYSIDAMSVGDILIVANGVYTEKIKLKSGITIRAKNPRKAVLTGCERLTNFVQHSGNIYKTQVSGDVHRVFFNKEPMEWAKWPNNKWSENWVFDKKWKRVSSAGPGYLNSDFSGIQNLNLTGAYCFIRYQKGNSCYSRTIKSYNGTRLDWDDTNFYTKTYSGEDGTVGNPNNTKFFLAGDIDLLDAPGEWFVENNTLYLIPPSGENPDNEIVFAQKNILTIEEGLKVSNITFDGVDFFAGSVRLNNLENTNISFKNVNFSYIGGDKLFVDRVQGEANDKPIEVDGTNISFEDCLFAGAQNTALLLDGSNITIRNCVFMENNRHANFESRPLILTARGMYTITQNTFFNNCSDAIRITYRHSTFPLGVNPEFSYNNLFNAGLFNSDVSGLYFPHSSAYFTQVHHNWMHSVNGNALRMDLAGLRLSVHHNVFWESKRGINLEGYRDFNVYNNTSVLNDDNGLTQNQMTHFPDNAIADGDFSYPPISKWNIVNNIVDILKDYGGGLREASNFLQSQNQGILHPERAASKDIAMGKNRGSILSNITNQSGYSDGIFNSISLSSLNLVPAKDVINNGQVQTLELTASGVTSLDSFRGAYAHNNPNPWSAGSNWMPFGLPVMFTMAKAQEFASYSKYISVVPEVVAYYAYTGQNTQYAIPPPTGLKATNISSNRVDLVWIDKSTGETDFRVKRKFAGGNWEHLATLDADATTYSDTSVIPNTAYVYRVAAFVGETRSDYSNEYLVTTDIVNTDIKTNKIDYTIHFYPNPVQNILYVETGRSDEFAITSIEVLDLSGRILKKEKTNKSIAELTIGDLSNGVYLIRLKNGSSSRSSVLIKH